MPRTPPVRLPPQGGGEASQGWNRQGRVWRFEGFVKQVSFPGVVSADRGTQRPAKINSSDTGASWPEMCGRVRQRPFDGPWLIPGAPVGLMG
ncbi:hypothetical protein GCM10010236_36700 [Streptomyces eurythermus]|nr:hypothetical protein GCM10010236_36700 [Streptomyces eurythermus]